MRQSKPKPLAYAGTSVPVMTTQQAIQDLLLRYGSTKIAWQSLVTQDGSWVQLRFERGDRVYRIDAPLGTDPAENRQHMRALYWGLKSTLEMAEFGIFKFEQVFLSFTELMLPDGSGTRTVGEAVEAQIGAHRVPSLTQGMNVKALPAPGEAK